MKIGSSRKMTSELAGKISIETDNIRKEEPSLKFEEALEKAKAMHEVE